MTDYDGPWKEALDTWFEPFMALLFPDAHAGIDWSCGYEPLDKELAQVTPEAEAGRRVADKLVKVWRHDGSEEWVLVHVEVQSHEESDFAQRMYVYHYRIFDRYARKVASLAVLGDDRPGWRPDHFGYNLWRCSVDFRFPAVKLLDFAGRMAELEQSANPMATVVLAHLKTRETHRDDENRRRWKLRLIKNLYDRGWTPVQVRQLFRIIGWLMSLPSGIDKQIWQEVLEYQQEKQMPYMTSMEQMWLETGIEKGIEKGRTEGLAQGIEVALELKFGASGVALMPEIRKITDLELLRTIARSIPKSATPEDLRRIWSPDSPTANAE